MVLLLFIRYTTIFHVAIHQQTQQISWFTGHLVIWTIITHHASWLQYPHNQALQNHSLPHSSPIAVSLVMSLAYRFILQKHWFKRWQKPPFNFFFFFIVLALFSDHMGNSYTVMPKLLIKLSVLSSLHFHSISDLDYRVHCFTNLLTFTLNSLDHLCFCHLALNTIVLYQPDNTRFFAGENHRKQEKWFL